MKKMKKLVPFFTGMLVATLIFALALPAMADGRFTELKDVMVGGVRIVVDGQELHPTDVNGTPVEPLVYNGTTYLPVRAVSNALGKAVYWDGPSFTVYLGDMDGQLESPTVMLTDLVSIASKPKTTDDLTDNYGNRYGSAITNYGMNQGTTMEYLLNMKYSRFKAVLYVPEGQTSDKETYVTVSADGHVLYTSPAMTKASAPVPIDVNVTGYNDVSIQWSSGGYGSSVLACCLADAGFYQ